LVALDRRFVLLNSRALGVVSLSRHRQLGIDDCRATGESALGVFEIGLILGLVCLGLFELRLIRPRLDLH
jgi:uncharacterized membrane protein YGL010W